MTKFKVTVKGYRFVPYKSCSNNNLKSAKHLIKFQRKVSQNKKVCHAQSFGSHSPSSRLQLQVIGLFPYNGVPTITHKGLSKFNQNLTKWSAKFRKRAAQNIDSDDQGHYNEEMPFVKIVLAIT